VIMVTKGTSLMPAQSRPSDAMRLTCEHVMRTTRTAAAAHHGNDAYDEVRLRLQPLLLAYLETVVAAAREKQGLGGAGVTVKVEVIGISALVVIEGSVKVLRSGLRRIPVQEEEGDVGQDVEDFCAHVASVTKTQGKNGREVQAHSMPLMPLTSRHQLYMRRVLQKFTEGMQGAQQVAACGTRQLGQAATEGEGHSSSPVVLNRKSSGAWSLVSSLPAMSTSMNSQSQPASAISACPARHDCNPPLHPPQRPITLMAFIAVRWPPPP
jgi:hypothetical protein